MEWRSHAAGAVVNLLRKAVTPVIAGRSWQMLWVAGEGLAWNCCLHTRDYCVHVVCDSALPPWWMSALWNCGVFADDFAEFKSLKPLELERERYSRATPSTWTQDDFDTVLQGFMQRPGELKSWSRWHRLLHNTSSHVRAWLQPLKLTYTSQHFLMFAPCTWLHVTWSVLKYTWTAHVLNA